MCLRLGLGKIIAEISTAAIRVGYMWKHSLVKSAQDLSLVNEGFKNIMLTRMPVNLRVDGPDAS